MTTMIKAIQRSFMLLTVSLVITGCSFFAFTYSYADTFIRWQLDDYFDLTQQQETWLRPRLTELLRWHKEEELPVYASVLKQLKAEGEDGFDRAELNVFWEQLNSAYLRLATKLQPDVVDFLLMLEPAQVDFLEQKMQTMNAERMAERGNTPEEQATYGKKRFIDNLERWTGPLTPAQQEEFGSRYLANRAAQAQNGEDWDSRRQASQAAWIRMLRSKPDRKTVTLWVDYWLVYGTTPDTSPDLAAREARIQANLQRALEIDQALNQKQRDRAGDELQKWINRINSII